MTPCFFLKGLGLFDDINCVLWGDTVYDALRYFGELRHYGNFVVSSHWNYMMFHQTDLTPKAVVKRHIKPIFSDVKKTNYLLP